MRYTTTQRIGALRYRPEGCGFDYRLDFLLPESFQQHYGTWFESAFKRNEYQWYLLRDKGGRCVGLTTSPTFMCVLYRNFWSLDLLEL
jgi:hypothetical protein